MYTSAGNKMRSGAEKNGKQAIIRVPAHVVARCIFFLAALLPVWVVWTRSNLSIDHCCRIRIIYIVYVTKNRGDGKGWSARSIYTAKNPIFRCFIYTRSCDAQSEKISGRAGRCFPKILSESGSEFSSFILFQSFLADAISRFVSFACICVCGKNADCAIFILTAMCVCVYIYPMARRLIFTFYFCCRWVRVRWIIAHRCAKRRRRRVSFIVRQTFVPRRSRYCNAYIPRY